MIISKREVVFRFFLMNPSGESHLREISRRTGVSLPWVRKAILEFARQGLVSVRRQGSLVLVKASRDNPRFRDLKRWQISSRSTRAVWWSSSLNASRGQKL